jgi:hypothetical protein
VTGAAGLELLPMQIGIGEGIKRIVDWYRSYYGVRG